jgi:hypothetical protein
MLHNRVSRLVQGGNKIRRDCCGHRYAGKGAQRLVPMDEPDLAGCLDRDLLILLCRTLGRHSFWPNLHGVVAVPVRRRLV